MSDKKPHPNSLKNLENRVMFSKEYQPRGYKKSPSKRFVFNRWLNSRVHKKFREDLATALEGMPVPEELSHFDAIVLRLFSIIHHDDATNRERIQAMRLVFEYAIDKTESEQPIEDQDQNDLVDMTEEELLLHAEQLRDLVETIKNDRNHEFDPAEIIEENGGGDGGDDSEERPG